MASRPPSGAQVELRHGDQRAIAVEVGGGLRAYEAGGRAIVAGYGEEEMCTVGRGQVLLPWPNRIAQGRYEYQGRKHELPVDEASTGCALHGLVRWSSWRVERHEGASATLAYAFHPRPGYPFALDLAIDYRLDDRGLSVTTRATNVGTEPCPFGAGWHPYLATPEPVVDAALLRLPAGTAYAADERGIPISHAPVDGTELDFRAGRPIGATQLDTAFADLERDADGLARVRFEPEPGRSVTLWVDGAFQYLMVFTGDKLPTVRRRCLAVEPMTCAPNAFVTGDGLLELAPGESWSGAWGLRPGAD